MDTQGQCLIALEIAHERVREAEARARLRWGAETEPPVGRRITVRVASLGRILSRTAWSRNEQGRELETAAS
jgi:hypothetical protein